MQLLWLLKSVSDIASDGGGSWAGVHPVDTHSVTDPQPHQHLHHPSHLGERVPARVACVHLVDLDRVVAEVVVQHVREVVPIQVLAVVPHGEETKHLAVVVKELAQVLQGLGAGGDMGEAI